MYLYVACMRANKATLEYHLLHHIHVYNNNNNNNKIYIYIHSSAMYTWTSHLSVWEVLRGIVVFIKSEC